MHGYLARNGKDKDRTGKGGAAGRVKRGRKIIWQPFQEEKREKGRRKEGERM